MRANSQPVRVAIACGGTGGHLFPGLAVGEQLANRGCVVTLLVSPKEIDQQALKDLKGLEIATLPAIGLSRGRSIAFFQGLIRSYRFSRRLFATTPPQAVLAMGGFTSAAPILAAKRLAARTFLHESNSIPGRANRWLSRLVDCAFVGFPSATALLHCRRMTVTGTPVRSHFTPLDPRTCRTAFGLDPDHPVVLITGGSQGARAINDLVLRSLPLIAPPASNWQWLHLTGHHDHPQLAKAYSNSQLRAVVRPFLAEMDLALGAATVAVSRAGASSLAELAAMRLPSILIPFPAATYDHQTSNARAFEQSRAADLLPQRTATPEKFAQRLLNLMQDGNLRNTMQAALAQWHAPRAAEQIAETILSALAVKWTDNLGRPASNCPPSPASALPGPAPAAREHRSTCCLELSP